MATPQLNPIELSMQQLDQIQKDTMALSNSAGRSFGDAYKYACVAQQVMNALTPEVMSNVLLPLRNKDFGWREDKAGQYNLEQLKDVFTSAILYGALPTNNEILVISGRFYPQKSFFTRKLAELPGLTELILQPGKVSVAPNGGALVEYTATWKFNGKAMSMARTAGSAIPVRLNAGQGVDAALGKAERKLKAAIFNQLTGSSFAEGEADEVVVEGVASVSGVVITDETSPGTEAPVAEPAPAAPTKQRVSKTKEVAAAVAQNAPAAAASGPQAWEGGTPAPSATVEQPKATQAAATTATTQQRQPAPAGQPGPGAKTAAAAPAANTKPTTVAQAATTTVPTPALSPSPKFDMKTGTGEIEEVQFLITAIEGKNPPHRIILEDGIKYWTKDTEKAKKAKELKLQNVPALVQYTVEPSGKEGVADFRLLVDVQAADFGNGAQQQGENDDFGNDGDGAPATE